MHHDFRLGYEDTMTLTLPDGQKVKLQLSHIEDDALPELHLWFERMQTVNCWAENGEKALPDEDMPNVLDVQSLVIPIVSLDKRAVAEGQAECKYDTCDGSGIRPFCTTGFLDPIDNIPAGYVVVERCDGCGKYVDDLEAAEAWGTDAKLFSSPLLAYEVVIAKPRPPGVGDVVVKLWEAANQYHMARGGGVLTPEAFEAALNSVKTKN